MLQEALRFSWKNYCLIQIIFKQLEKTLIVVLRIRDVFLIQSLRTKWQNFITWCRQDKMRSGSGSKNQFLLIQVIPSNLGQTTEKTQTTAIIKKSWGKLGFGVENTMGNWKTLLFFINFLSSRIFFPRNFLSFI